MAKATKKLAKPLSDGGYKPKFIGSKFNIKFPELNDSQKADLLKFQSGKFRLDFIHYSVVMSKKRRLAYFTAVNIDGTKWQDNSRKGTWQNDTRITSEDQLGQKLYDAPKSIFDRGHLVRREDPEWGDKTLSKKAGENTFWFPNCTPQHKDLNQKIWADLEANILHVGADQQNLKVNVFTGPILDKKDGIFVSKVGGNDIQIPNLFWKVVVWTKSNGKAYAVGFLQSQEKFLIRDGIIKKQLVVNKKALKKLKDEDIFEHLKFKDGKTYQVKLKEIEKLSGLKFDWPGVIKPFKAKTSKALEGTSIKQSKVSKKALAGPPGNMKRNIRVTGLVL